MKCSTAWCSEIGSLWSLDSPELHAWVTPENQFHCTRLYIDAQFWNFFRNRGREKKDVRPHSELTVHARYQSVSWPKHGRSFPWSWEYQRWTTGLGYVGLHSLFRRFAMVEFSAFLQNNDWTDLHSKLFFITKTWLNSLLERQRAVGSHFWSYCYGKLWTCAANSESCLFAVLLWKLMVSWPW